MFARDPFDVAPGAQGHTSASWFALAICVLFAGLCGWQLVGAMEALSRAEQARIEEGTALRSRANRDAAVQRQQSDPAALDRARAEQALQGILRRSWSSLFDALETATGATNGGATIVSLAPIMTNGDGAEIAITAMATSVPVMLDYVKSLQSSEHIKRVQLSAQQPVTASGIETVRFQLSLLWVPDGRTPIAGARVHASEPTR